MSRVLQVRGVPDDVHETLRREAEARGESLTRFVLTELQRLAGRAALARENADTVRHTQAEVGAPADRASILAAIREGRGE